jgi:hypothetical protein
MFLYTEILALICAICLGHHDAPACDAFTIYGSGPKEQARFHRSNFQIKAAITTLMALAVLYSSFNWVLAVLVIIPNTMILWAGFNVSLNVARQIERSWDYISPSSNKTDVWLHKRFGKHAGRVLVFGAIIVTLLSTILCYHLYAESCPNCFRLVPVR